MIPHLRVLTLAIHFFVAIVCPSSGANEPSVTPQEGILVLRNGRVVHGDVTRLGDRFLVTSGDDHEVRLAAVDVELHCRSLEEAYFQKRAQLRGGRAGPRLELAEWCLRQQLFARAADQVLAALVLEPDNPRVAALERRLIVGAQTSATVPAAASPRATETALESLDRLMHELPPGAVEHFTSAVQPVLMNNCSTSACHGPNAASTYRLMRPALGAALTRPLTQRNLHATLHLIDRQHPQQSRLLTVPLGPHGSAPAAIFGDREQVQYARLVAWVQQVTQGKNAAPSARIEYPEASLLQASPLPAAFWDEPNADPLPPPHNVAGPAAFEQAAFEQAAFDQASLDQARFDLAASQSMPATTDSAATTTTDRGSQRLFPPLGKPFVPRDEFDPEIFNRRFFGPSD